MAVDCRVSRSPSEHPYVDWHADTCRQPLTACLGAYVPSAYPGNTLRSRTPDDIMYYDTLSLALVLLYRESSAGRPIPLRILPLLPMAL